LEEIGQELNPNSNFKASLPNLLRFGLYPQVIPKWKEINKIEELAENLFPIIYTRIYSQLSQIKKRGLLFKLLSAYCVADRSGILAKIGNWHSSAGTNVHTGVSGIWICLKKLCDFQTKFISAEILEKKLPEESKNPISRCGESEIAIIRNFNEMQLRNWCGLVYGKTFASLSEWNTISFIEDLLNTYFWRNYDQKEDRTTSRGTMVFFIVLNSNIRINSKGKIPSEFWKKLSNFHFKVISPAKFLWLYR